MLKFIVNSLFSQFSIVVGIFCSVILVFVVACTPSPMVTKPDDAKRLVDSLEYVQAKNGLCYGVSTVKRVSSNGSVAENQMLVHVPCDVVLKLAK